MLQIKAIVCILGIQMKAFKAIKVDLNILSLSFILQTIINQLCFVPPNLYIVKGT